QAAAHRRCLDHTRDSAAPPPAPPGGTRCAPHPHTPRLPGVPCRGDDRLWAWAAPRCPRPPFASAGQLLLTARQLPPVRTTRSSPRPLRHFASRLLLASAPPRP